MLIRIIIFSTTLISTIIAEQKFKVLTFGGNGNIGSSTVKQLLDDGRFDISIVTRGSWHWDAKERIKPFVQEFVCDRDYQPECASNKTATDCDINAVRQCSDLLQFIKATDKFDMVIDFSAYHPKWVHDNIEVLKGKIGVYIYISTDSIYEVCIDKPFKRPSVETDDERPKDEKEVELLKKKDPYGHYKFVGEEALVHYAKKDGLNWVALRLADVIGPRDTTYRWWMYQLWIKFYPEINKPISIPAPIKDKVESLTYVEDVGQAILKVFNLGPQVWNQAYNIAMDEEFSLSNILLRIRDGIDQQNVMSEVVTDSNAYHGYPSVMMGPVDITKAREKLGFEPTDVEEAIRTTIHFHEDAFAKFPKQRDLVLKDLFSIVVPKDRKDAVYAGLDREFTKHGIVDKRYRKARKGEVSGLPVVVNTNAAAQKLEL